MSHSYDTEYFNPSNHIFQFLSKDVDGSQSIANINANGDYSSVKGKFLIHAPVGYLYVLTRMIIYIQDTGSFRSEGYGAQATPLTNGLNLCLCESGVENVITSKPIQHNAEWGMYNYDVDVKTWGAGDESLLARWSFFLSGQPFTVDGDREQSFGIILNDNMSFLVEHHFHIQGYKIKK